MIIVTAATGRLGAAVVDRLLNLLDPAEVGAAVRDPSRAQHLRERGVTVRQADYDRPETLAPAFEGAAQVLLVSGPADPAPHRAAIDAARTAGVGRVVYTSHQAASSRSRFAAAAAHARTEQDLEQSGLGFTILRNGFYASSALQLMGPVAQTGTIAVPADGPVSWTAHADLAEAAATVLTEPQRHDGQRLTLTGSRSLDFGDLAEVVSEAWGRPVARVVVDDEDWVAGLRSFGMPAEQARFLLGIFEASRAGELDVVDPALAGLLGRTPTGVPDVVAAELPA